MNDEQSQNSPLKPLVRRDVIRGEGCGWDGRVAGADEQRVMDGLSVAWRIDGLSDSLAWRVMAGLSVARRIVLWSAEFYGRPSFMAGRCACGCRVVIRCCLLLGWRVLFSSFVVFVFSLLLVQISNGFYKLPEN
jgi:hypothetical protein